MGVRTLDWLGLLEVAQGPKSARRVLLAGLPAEVITSRGTDVGFYVRQSVGEDYAGDEFWALKTTRELALLRALVAAGQVTVDDGLPDDKLDVHLVEVRTFDGVLIRTTCAVCGAGPDTAHDPDVHNQFDAALAARDRES